MKTDYKEDLNRRYWEYQKTHFSTAQTIFERPYTPDGRPPVFIRTEAWRNVIISPTASQQDKERLLALVRDGDRHKWYGSMNSSQALAQSVFGNLAIYNCLHYLSELKDDEGMPLFEKAQGLSNHFEMEHKIKFLGEPRPSSLDGYIPGDYQIAIECKFTEAEVGTCSRPRLAPRDLIYDIQHCNGSYSIQKARKERCSLSEFGVKYWHYVPRLFK